jgi:hypothetical protein
MAKRSLPSPTAHSGPFLAVQVVRIVVIPVIISVFAGVIILRRLAGTALQDRGIEMLDYQFLYGRQE